jgi:hypothetical protein
VTLTQRQRFGAVAALIAAGTFVFGFVLFATSLSDYTTGDPTPAESVTFLVANQTVLYIWNFVILIVFGIALTPLVLALYERLWVGAPMLAPTAAAFGIIWAGLVIAAGMIGNIGIDTVAGLADSDRGRAETVWTTLDSVQNGLGGGNEIVGGLWLVLVSVASRQTAALPRALTHLGILSGTAGILTVVPMLEMAGAVFGLGLIVWFVWAGLTMLRSDWSGVAPRHGRGDNELVAGRQQMFVSEPADERA